MARLLLLVALLWALADPVLAGPIGSSTATGGGHTIQDEGSDLGERTYLNFEGASVSCVESDASTITCTVTSGAGQAVVLDLGDDGGNDSIDIGEIATIGDTNSIFTEPSADKLLITVSNRWPVSDLARNVTGTTDSAVTVNADTDVIIDLDEDNDGTESLQILDGADATVVEIAESGLITTLVGIDAIGAVDFDIGSGDVTDVTVTTDGGAIVLDGNITQDAGTTLFMGGLLDATGAVDMDYGSVDITDHTFVTDGTGTAEVVLPAGSIDSTEILDSTILAADMGDSDHGDVSWSSNVATVDAVDLETGAVTNIADTEILVGVGAGDASYVTVSGDATLANTGALTISAGAVEENMLAASLVFDDGDLLNLSAVSITGTAEGLILPQHATDCSSAGTAEGQVCWEADADTLYIGTGAGVQAIAAGGAFSDAADPVVLNTTTKDVQIGDTGASNLAGKVEIGGDADQPQLLVEGHSTQTSDVVVVQNDANTELVAIDNSGNADFAGSVTAASYTVNPSATPSILGQDSDMGGTPDTNWNIVGNCPTGTTAGGDEDCDLEIGVQGGGSMTNILKLDTTDAGATTVQIGAPGTNYVNVDEAGAMTAVGSGSIEATTLSAALDTKAELESELTDVADFAEADGDTFTGVHDFGGATSLEIPNDAAPTVNAAGEIAVDTTITSHNGMIRYYDGTTEMIIPAIPSADLTTNDNHIIKYDLAGTKFTMEVDQSVGSPTFDTIGTGENTSATMTVGTGSILEIGAGTFQLEGATANAFEGIFAVTDPTADRTYTFPDATGEVSLLGQEIASSEITDATIAQVDADDTATLAGNPAFGDSSVWFATTGLIFEGATSNTNELLLISSDVTADRTITLPDATTTLVGTDATQTLTGKTIDETNTVTINASDITDLSGNTDITADLEEEAHCSEHDSADVDCSGETIVFAADSLDFTEIVQSNTLAGNPALAVDECFFALTTSGGGFICEGSTANTNEQLYLFPDVDGADTTNRIVVHAAQVTDVAGTNLTVTAGTLDVDDAFITNNADDTMQGDLIIDDTDNATALQVYADSADSAASVGILISTDDDDSANYDPFEIRDDRGVNNDLLFAIDHTGTITTGIVPDTIVDGYTASMHWGAGAFSSDGTQCADPAEATINSGQKMWTVICADNDGSTIYGNTIMPDGYTGGTVTFELSYVQTAADTGALNADVAAQCRGATEALSTWGTEIAIDDAAVTGSNAIDMTTSAAVTPVGTCAAGDFLGWRIQLDATGTTTAVGTLHLTNVKMEYPRTSLAD